MGSASFRSDPTRQCASQSGARCYTFKSLKCKKLLRPRRTARVLKSPQLETQTIGSLTRSRFIMTTIIARMAFLGALACAAGITACSADVHDNTLDVHDN